MMEGHRSTNNPPNEPSPAYFVAVHIGAGRHSRKAEQLYKAVMKEACQQAEVVLRGGSTALDAVVAAIKVLENSEICNAGMGSNWTFGGHVECDASVMSGDGAFGAVGAVSGIKNPVTAAARLACQSRMPMPLQRVPPMFLAGDMAREWAHQQGLCAAADRKDVFRWHKSEAAQVRWKRYHKMLSTAMVAPQLARCLPWPYCPPHKPTAPAPQKADAARASFRQEDSMNKRVALDRSSAPEPASDGDECLLLDTVGAVCVDSSGRLASGVSSGGIALKVDGRVGEAAMYGCGCYAQGPSDTRPGVACSVTGVGETIMRAGLARAVCTQILQSPAIAVDSVCETSIRENILEGQPAAISCPHKDCGILAVRVNAPGGQLAQGQQSASHRRADSRGSNRHAVKSVDVEIGIACNSSSMGFAFLHGGMRLPECVLLRQGSEASGNRTSYDTFCCFGSQHSWDVSL